MARTGAERVALNDTQARQRDFWQTACRAVPDLSPSADYQVWHFGDSEALARDLADLVLHGPKRATAGLLWDAELDPTMMPVQGGYSLVTDHAWAYFSRRCEALGRAPSNDMPVILERFSLIYPVGRS